ncbi:MAG TPA: phage holin family protein [Burkholderiales bacterium]|nr:phage holin family protein [Burkholderiales bacterium]
MDERDKAVAPEEGLQVGLFDSLKALLVTLVDIAHTRIELISTEVEEQFARLVSLLVWGLVAMFFAFTGVILSAIALIAVFWESNRVLAAAGLALTFMLLAVIAVLVFIARAKARPPLFKASLDELAKDRRQLNSR